MKKILKAEIKRLDDAALSKRHEKIITRFTKQNPPRAIINSKPYLIVNSNDYMGLRFNPKLRAAEEKASRQFGTGPGAVRFISGSLAVHRDLEKALAKFHGRDDAIVFSSAFATNLAVIACLMKGQSRGTLVSDKSVVISDELNHRSIIDGVRVASLEKEQKAIFKHLDMEDLGKVIKAQIGKFDRVVIVTDGIFSMLGEYQDLKGLRRVINQHKAKFKEGIVLMVDDAHGIGAFGPTGRGVEEVTGAQADVLVGTLGKAFGADGGYVVADQLMIDYLRESAATYIYSNSISPGTAGAALAGVNIMSSAAGKKLLTRSRANMALLKQLMHKAGLKLAVDSIHPIQPWLVGDPQLTKKLSAELFKSGYLVTPINYPVVPQGKDEIRIQISASHTSPNLREFVKAMEKAAKKFGLI